MMEADEKCSVISGDFAWAIQVVLGVAACTSLLAKRFMEQPRRPLLIWLMDSTKQAAALGMQHFVNILLAVLFATGKTRASECIWFAANLLIAVVCGLAFLAVYMQLQRLAVRRWRLDWLRSGDYGVDARHPRWDWWLAQLVLWVVVCCTEKFITAAAVIMPLRRQIDGVICTIEEPLQQYPKTELVLVMVVFPAFLNAIFAWAVDNLIKQPPDEVRRTGSIRRSDSWMLTSNHAVSSHMLASCTTGNATTSIASAGESVARGSWEVTDPHAPRRQQQQQQQQEQPQVTPQTF
jgi:hypothetical protein